MIIDQLDLVLWLSQNGCNFIIKSGDNGELMVSLTMMTDDLLMMNNLTDMAMMMIVTQTYIIIGVMMMMMIN